MQNLWGLFHLWYVLSSRDEGELAAKLVWRVKLVTEKPTIPEQIADRVEVCGCPGGPWVQCWSGYRVDRLRRLFVRTPAESRAGVMQPARVWS
jgi:hypothetical protein